MTWEGKGKIFRQTGDGPGYLPLILVSIEGEHLGKSWGKRTYLPVLGMSEKTGFPPLGKDGILPLGDTEGWI